MEPITSATVPDTSTNQRRKKRYLIFNSQDLEDLYWKNVKLCNIRKTVLSNEIEEDMGNYSLDPIIINFNLV